jgi:molecular chaperone GrpE
VGEEMSEKEVFGSEEKVEEKALEEEVNQVETNEKIIEEDRGIEEEDAHSVEESLEAIAQELAEKERMVEEYKNYALRMQADFENYKKRVQNEKEEMQRRIKGDLLLQILPIIDDFERALSTEEKNEKFAEGVKMIFCQLQMVLESFGLTKMETLNADFNPEYHEAVMTIEDENLPKNTVVEELRSGYLLNGKVLRPAMVKVVKE